MGIPKFYRWLSERYPLTNQPIASTHVPVMDNLYLDMNGIIHNCTHGNDPNVKLTEEEMILKVFAYIEKLFQIVQPQKLLFAAIDGCAPRAKMNQQRGRRFKAAKAAAEAAAKREKEEPGAEPTAESFDSNCITPGTPFMGRLAAHLCFFFRKKISEDPAWQRPRIIFSGHDVPGEGEHKIMEHIRWAKRQPDYEPNQRHCLYGLDADLIMLSLVSHEPHFCLLREVVKYGGSDKGQPSREVLQNPKKEHFVLFQIGLLREYFELELRPVQLGFPFDVERFVDDFVLFCMLIGNDFLPTLPTLDVNEGALDQILTIYKRLLPEMGGYLTDSGRLNLQRLEQLLAELAELELETLEQRAADAEYFEKKRKRGGGGRPQAPAWDNDAQNSHLHDKNRGKEAKSTGKAKLMNNADFRALMDLPEDFEADVLLEEPQPLEPQNEEPPMQSAEPTMMSKAARQLVLAGDGKAGLQLWKERHYEVKLEIDPKDPQAIQGAVKAFIEGLQWVLEYYYRGVISWEWFYPFHYAPMISDMKDLSGMEASFVRGEPFTPYEQLLAVLPAASHKLLPKPYQWLMTDSASPIADFYPLSFALDAEGKRQDWEAVVVLNFISVPRLRDAARSVPTQQLSAEELQRNASGQLLHFFHDAGSEETSFCASTLPSRLSSIHRSASRCVEHQPPPPLPDGQPGFTPTLVQGTVAGKGGPPGFPTLKTLELEGRLQMAGVEALGQASKRESLIVQITGKQAEAAQAPAQQVAEALLGQRIWVKWPYLQEAIIQAVSDANAKVDTSRGLRPHSKEEGERWRRDAAILSGTFRKKQGIDTGALNLLLHVRPCEGLMRRLDGTVEKRFAQSIMTYPIQVAVKHNPSPDPRLEPSTAEHSGAVAFPAGSTAIFVGKAHFGCFATVLPPPSTGEKEAENGNRSLLRVHVIPAPASAFSAMQTAKKILSGFQANFMPSYQAARRLGMSPRVLAILTSNCNIRVGEKRIDVGLNVKHVPKGLCVPDYVKAQPDQQGWLYSPALLQVFEEYKARHGWVLKAISNSTDAYIDLDAATLLPALSAEEQLATVMKVRSWLASLPLSKRVLVKTTATVATESAIRTLQQALPPNLTRPQEPVELENVSPALLLAPNDAVTIPSELAGGGAKVGDRIVFVGRGGPPPLGARGTVVGEHEDDLEVLFDAPFTGGNDLQGRCMGDCGAVVSVEEILNLTMPQQAENKSPQPIQAPTKPWREVAAQQRPPGFQTRLNNEVRANRGPAAPCSSGGRGFAFGRGQPLSNPPELALQISGPPGMPLGLSAPSGAADSSKPRQSHPLLLALKTPGASVAAPDFEHKVHKGMSAAHEILRLSQQDLLALEAQSRDAEAELGGGALPPTTSMPSQNSQPSKEMDPIRSLMLGRSGSSASRGAASSLRPPPAHYKKPQDESISWSDSRAPNAEPPSTPSDEQSFWDQLTGGVPPRRQPAAEAQAAESQSEGGTALLSLLRQPLGSPSQPQPAGSHQSRQQQIAPQQPKRAPPQQASGSTNGQQLLSLLQSGSNGGGKGPQQAPQPLHRPKPGKQAQGPRPPASQNAGLQPPRPPPRPQNREGAHNPEPPATWLQARFSAPPGKYAQDAVNLPFSQIHPSGSEWGSRSPAVASAHFPPPQSLNRTQGAQPSRQSQGALSTNQTRPPPNPGLAPQSTGSGLDQLWKTLQQQHFEESQSADPNSANQRR